jgi:hypothetical protein
MTVRLSTCAARSTVAIACTVVVLALLSTRIASTQGASGTGPLRPTAVPPEAVLQSGQLSAHTAEQTSRSSRSAERTRRPANGCAGRPRLAPNFHPDAVRSASPRESLIPAAQAGDTRAGYRRSFDENDKILFDGCQVRGKQTPRHRTSCHLPQILAFFSEHPDRKMHFKLIGNFLSLL